MGTLVEAMRSRERVRVTVDAKLRDLDVRISEAAKLDLDGHEADLRVVLNDWHAMLDHDTALGRRSLRDVLLSPIFVKQEADGTWSYRLIGWFGGVIKQVWGVQVSDADIAEVKHPWMPSHSPAGAWKAIRPTGSSNRRSPEGPPSSTGYVPPG